MANPMTSQQYPSSLSGAGGASHQVVHVASNIDENMHELFKVVEQPANSLPQVPMRNRKLPPSFFRPPSASSSASHSRESSLDATSSFNCQKISGGSPSAGKPPTPSTINSPLSPASPQAQANGLLGTQSRSPHGLTIIHSKANSMPASLQQFSCSTSPGLSSGQNLGQPSMSPMVQAHKPNQGVHFRQHSYDITKKNPNSEEWDPRKMAQMNSRLQGLFNSSSSQQQQLAANQQVAFSSQPSIQQVIGQQQVFDPSRLSLPPGWEQAVTESGDVYYINHNDRTTSWHHPNMAQHSQIKVQPNSSITPPDFLYQISPAGCDKATAGSNGNIPSELVAAMQKMKTSSPSSDTMMVNQNVRDLERERQMLRQRGEEIRQNPRMRPIMPNSSNYLDVQNSDPMLSEYNHGRQSSLDSGLGSNGANNAMLNSTLNPSSMEGLFSDFTPNSLRLGNIGGNLLEDEDVFERFDGTLDNIELDLDFDELINPSRESTMTWHV